MIGGLISALRFLTVVPFKASARPDNFAAAMAFFPFVGLFLGTVLCGVNFLLVFFHFPEIAAAVILTVVWIILSGGMHLDGLSDTADAFLSGKAKADMLAIMRDPHIGVMGALSLISVVLLKVALLISCGAALRPAALLVSCVLSRWAVIPLLLFVPYARKEGKAAVFTEQVSRKIFILATLAALLFVCLAAGACALLLAAAVFCLVYLFGRLCFRKVGGITGDTLGAGIEITEVFSLLLMFICGFNAK